MIRPAAAALTLAVAAAALPVHAAPAAARPAAEAREASQRTAIFDRVWETVRDLYYDPRLNGVDWQAVRERYRPRVAAAEDEPAFIALLRAMTGELRDAHTRVLTAAQARDRRESQTVTTGAILFEVEGVPVLFDVRPGTPAAAAGLRPGMRVLAVNGMAIAEALARARADVGPSSSERAALVLSYLRLVSGPGDEPLGLDLLAPNGERVQVSLARQRIGGAPVFEARRLPEGPLYVRFDRFRAPVARLFRAALAANRNAPALILDLRSNTGGDGREGLRIAAPLLTGPTLVARLRTRTGRAPSALLGLVRLPLEMRAGTADGQMFDGPVAILVNEATASTSEVIAGALQERGRARVVGTRSCGCALGVLRYRRLANGALLAVSEVGLVTGMGRRIEGEGVAPDVVAAPTLESLRQGIDSQLAAAIAEVTRLAGR
jgi:carboxyl-terminal processing protease